MSTNQNRIQLFKEKVSSKCFFFFFIYLMIGSWKIKIKSPLQLPGSIIWFFWKFLKNVELPFNIQNHREHSFYINYIIITHNCYQRKLYMSSTPIWLKKGLKGNSGGTFGKSFFPFSTSISDKKGILYRMIIIIF